MAYPPSMMPNEFAGETTQSHCSWSAGREDNLPSSTVKCVCNVSGKAVMACVQALTSDSFGVASELVELGEGAISMKCGSSVIVVRVRCRSRRDGDLGPGPGRITLLNISI
jgi:hypothetical protein